MSSGKPFPLYIHIPFCRSKCIYCDFYSVPRPSDCNPVPEEYLHALRKEIEYRCREYAPESWRSVYFGGGTPSLLAMEQLSDLLEFVRNSVPGGIRSDAEVTLEANPADINSGFLKEAAEAGINRLSTGIQCCSQTVLKTLGRRSDAETIEKALSAIEETWLPMNGKRFSADLITGLPGLSNADFAKGVERIIRSGADHVSLYSLMVEEGTPLFSLVEEGKLVCSEDDSERQWFMGRDMLEAAGIHQYEISNFSRKGCESRHNLSYWHMDDFIGVGSGASGTVGCRRWTGLQPVEDYISAWLSGSGIPQEVEELDEGTREYEYLMMGFRLLEGVSSADYRSRFGRSLEQRLGTEDGWFRKWAQEGNAAAVPYDTDVRYALNRKGIMLLNRFLSRFSSC